MIRQLACILNAIFAAGGARTGDPAIDAIITQVLNGQRPADNDLATLLAVVMRRFQIPTLSDAWPGIAACIGQAADPVPDTFTADTQLGDLVP